MSRDSTNDPAQNSTPMTRRGALKGLSGVMVGTIGLEASTGTGAAAYETDPHSWETHDDYDTVYPSGTTHHVCSALKLVSTQYIPGGSNTDEYWDHAFQASSQVSAVETSSGDPIDNLRSQGIRIKNNDTVNVPVLASQNEKNNALAPHSDNPDHVEGFTGAITSAASIAITLAQSTPGALVLAGSQLSVALGQMAYDLQQPGDYQEYVWDGGYSGITKGAHQVVFDVHNYQTSTSSTPPVQISTHASQAYTGWDLHFYDDNVSASGASDSPDGKLSSMGDPREMSEAEKEKFGIRRVHWSELAKTIGEHRARKSGNEWVYIAEKPPVSVSPMTREESKELWD